MKTQYASIYKDHRQARQEHNPWFCAIERLRIKNNKTLAILAQIEGLTRRYDAELQTRMAGISAHELEIQLDELITTQREHIPDEDMFERLTAVHEQIEEELGDFQEEARHYRALRADYADQVRPLLEALNKLI